MKKRLQQTGLRKRSRGSSKSRRGFLLTVKTVTPGTVTQEPSPAVLDGVLNDLSQVEDPTGLRIHILQADCRADAETVRDGIRAAYPEVGEITITGLGVVIGAHCGPGLLTVFYLCNGRNAE